MMFERYPAANQQDRGANAWHLTGRIILLVMACWLSPRQQLSAAEPTLVKRAHAHNDYLHQRPLLDALEHGFNSVEADIFLVDDQLLVAHTQLELNKQRTLQALYLDPLKQRIAEQGGRVFRDGPAFKLLIDIKSDAEPTYLALHQLLAQYAEMLTKVEGDQVQPGAIDITISGNRPQALIAAQKVRYCGIDGRLSDLESDWPAHLLPMISDNWTNHFKWRGRGEMPANEKARLQQIVTDAHARGRIVRFWATPEEKALWQALVDADVDLINTDQLAELQAFLK